MAGGCACGRARFEAEIDNDDAYLCHCRMCQRATGSVSIAFKNLNKSAVRWLAEPELVRKLADRPAALLPGMRHERSASNIPTARIWI